MPVTAQTILVVLALVLFIISLFPPVANYPLVSVGGILLSVAALLGVLT